MTLFFTMAEILVRAWRRQN